MAMSGKLVIDLEQRIQESYERIGLGSTVYLLKGPGVDYDELPDPDAVNQVFKADVFRVDPEHRLGISVLGWSTLEHQLVPGIAREAFTLSPREVFKPREIKHTILHRTNLGKPRDSKLDQYIGSKSGKFGTTLAVAMARVVIERFEEDLRDSSGALVKR